MCVNDDISAGLPKEDAEERVREKGRESKERERTWKILSHDKHRDEKKGKKEACLPIIKEIIVPLPTVTAKKREMTRREYGKWRNRRNGNTKSISAYNTDEIIIPLPTVIAKKREAARRE